MPKRKRCKGGQKPASTHPKQAMDLFVPLPKNTSDDNLVLLEILKRLEDTGYKTIALTHIIYGKPDPKKDHVDIAIPTTLWKGFVTKMNILRRLHVIIENASDVALYGSQQSNILRHDDVLHTYDIISLAPRNDITFQAVCNSSTSSLLCDIITLDYGPPLNYLPFLLRNADVRTAVRNNIIFEIPYAIAILGKQRPRKSLVQIARGLQSAIIGGGKKQQQSSLLFSSGPRLTETNDDAGALAIRMPGDILNLMRVILGLNFITVKNAIEGQHVINLAKQRRCGNSTVTVLECTIEKIPSVVEKKNDGKSNKQQVKDQVKDNINLTRKRKKINDDNENDKEEENVQENEIVEDGFIAF